MLKISQAISHWTPAGDRFVADPLSLLQAGWSEIVGAEVAKNSSPSRIVAGTLIVVTRSAAWSHQLSFLAQRVRDAVAARLPSAGVERLRFRVGALPKRAGAPPPSRSPAGPRHAAQAAPAASADQALERFARNVDAAKRAKRAAGWKECAACGVLVAPSRERYCTTCGAERLQRRALATARLLFEAPW
ncbi:MAG TPA: DUF721 domain-containing protein, partial [Candidatus Cybelea sp.]